jgi:adenylate cyclase
MREIERKFLIKKLPSLEGLSYAVIKQGFIIKNDKGLLRVRTLVSENKKIGFITVKESGLLVRNEYEMEIPYDVAESFLFNCENLIDKQRYYIPNGETTIELDIFNGKLNGLLLAEIEMTDENQQINIPSWFGKEVTENPNYTNVKLAFLGIPK